MIEDGGGGMSRVEIRHEDSDACRAVGVEAPERDGGVAETAGTSAEIGGGVMSGRTAERGSGAHIGGDVLSGPGAW